MAILLIVAAIAFGLFSLKFMPDNKQTVWGLMEDSTSLITLITLFTIIVAGGIVANEFSWGTIKLLLIRPASRAKILLAKYLTVCMYTFTMLLLLFMASLVVSVSLYGWGTLDTAFISSYTGTYLEQNGFLHVLSLYLAQSVNVIILGTFAFMLSTVFRSSSLAIGFSLFLVFVGGNIVFVLSQFNYNWVKYILFANTDLLQYFYRQPPLEGMTLSFSLIMLLVYYFSFMTLAWVIFTKRDVAA